MKRAMKWLRDGSPWLVLGAVLLVTRLPMLGLGFINVDEAAHAVGAREFLQGGLYSTFVDNKPPLIYSFYALGGAHVQLVRLFATLLLVVPSAFFLTRSSQAAGSEGRRVLGLVFLVCSAGFVAADTQATNTELLTLPWLLAANALVLGDSRSNFSASAGAKRSAFSPILVGVLVGAATLAKQPSALFLLPAVIGVESLTVRRLVGRGLSVGAGFLLVLGAVSLVFLALGRHDAYWYWVWEFNAQHVTPPLPLGDVAVRFAKMGLPLVGVSSALWYAAWASHRTAPGGPRERYLAVCLAATLLPAFLGWRLFGHYFLPALPFLILLGERKLVDWFANGSRLAVSWVLAPGLVFSLLNPFLYRPSFGLAEVSDPLFRQLGERLREEPCHGPVFVWGYAPQIYYYAGRAPATRYVLPIEPITGYISGNEAFERGELPPTFHVAEGHRRRLLDDLKASRPALVVDLSGTGLSHWDQLPLSTFPQLEHWLLARYTPEKLARGAVLHRLVGCESAHR